MLSHKAPFALLLTMSSALSPVFAQTSATSVRSTPIAATASTVIPELMHYNGVVLQSDGKPRIGHVSVTFSVFKDERGGEPLWVETQSVDLDSNGRYDAHLGATSPSGLPVDLFSAGDVRWLEIQAVGEAQQPRVLLASVPYAMKAADAATLGGLPASAFALAGSVAVGTLATTASGVTPDAGITVTTTGGTAGYLPVYSGGATIDDSILFESGTKIGINNRAPAANLDVTGTIASRGLLTMESTGAATTAAGKDSQALQFISSAYSSSAKKALAPMFNLQAEPAANNSTAPGATLNFLYGNGANPTETGLNISSKGIIKFAAGQTFGSAESAGIAITGSSTSGTGVEGTSSTGNGVIGDTAGTKLDTAGTVGIAGSRNTSGFGGIAGVWGDAQGHVGVLGTSTQYSGVQGLSNSGPGVQGGSNTNDGVLGTTLGNTLGTAGVFGIAGARTNFGGIAAVWGDASAHVGVFGSSNQYAGVYGASTNGNGIQGSSVTGPGGSFTSAGADATVSSVNSSTNTNGGSAYYGVAEGIDTQAVFVLSEGSGGIGVAGYAGGGTDASGNRSIGLYGNTGSNGLGVQGYSGSGVGVFGISAVSSHIGSSLLLNDNGRAGIWGDTGTDFDSDNEQSLGGVAGSADNGNAGYFRNDSGNYATLYVENEGGAGLGPAVSDISGVLQANGAKGSCGIGSNGDLSCTGQVKTLTTTSNARMVETYAMQSPENWMEDFGSGSLSNGSATVTIDRAFAETANTGMEYHVFLTPRGDSKGLYVTNVSATSFEVKESSGGASSLAFDYRIVAKRKGYESSRLNDVTERFHAETVRAQRSRTKLAQARQAQLLAPRALHVPATTSPATATSAARPTGN